MVMVPLWPIVVHNLVTKGKIENRIKKYKIISSILPCDTVELITLYVVGSKLIIDTILMLTIKLIFDQKTARIDFTFSFFYILLSWHYCKNILYIKLPIPGA